MFKANAVYCFKSKAACEAFSMISDENFKIHHSFGVDYCDGSSKNFHHFARQ